MHTKTSESTISHFCFICFVYGKDFYGIFGTALDYGYTLKRINVCITAFFISTFDIWDFGNEATAGKGLTGIGYPRGVDPTTPRLPTATIRPSFEFFLFCLHFHSLATYILTRAIVPDKPLL